MTVCLDGFGGSYDHIHVGHGELPNELAGVLDIMGFPEPIAELEALARSTGNSDPRVNLPLAWIVISRRYIQKGKVPHRPTMNANAAYIEIHARICSA